MFLIFPYALCLHYSCFCFCFCWCMMEQLDATGCNMFSTKPWRTLTKLRVLLTKTGRYDKPFTCPFFWGVSSGSNMSNVSSISLMGLTTRFDISKFAPNYHEQPSTITNGNQWYQQSTIQTLIIELQYQPHEPYERIKRMNPIHSRKRIWTIN